ncbi:MULTISPECIES: hypothetical protein [Aquimarina]|uniref:hypothetical protein n=1 Tax=Aquimarina TaxID=290174 RepID=UPI000424D31E|nr:MULTISPECIES: hypothetical protein [Aquimarina]
MEISQQIIRKKGTGFKKDARNFSPSEKTLTNHGVTSITILIKNPKKVAKPSRLGIYYHRYTSYRCIGIVSLNNKEDLHMNQVL